MVDRDRNFASRLLSQQSMDPGLQEQYRKELKEMLEVKIEGRAKIQSIVIVAVRWVLGLICAYMFIYDPFHTPLLYRYSVGIVALMLILLSIIGTVVIIRGVYKHRTHGNLMAAIVFYFCIAYWLALFFSRGSETLFAVAGSIALTIGIYRMVFNLIQQSRLHYLEQQLNEEYRLADGKPRPE